LKNLSLIPRRYWRFYILLFCTIFHYSIFQARGEHDANLGSVPILVYNGVAIGQSKAIERFVAKRLGLFGSNEIEEARIDCIGEHMRDVKQKYSDAIRKKSGDELQESKNDFFLNYLPAVSKKIEKYLDPYGFAIGRQISYADVVLHQFYRDGFNDEQDEVKSLNAVADCPKIKSSIDKVAVAAKDWFENRPITSM